MHLAEGTVPLNQALGSSALAAPVLIWSLRGERQAQGAAGSPSAGRALAPLDARGEVHVWRVRQ